MPGVVLCHGLSAGKGAMRPVAQQLEHRGVGALTFDFRGHGESEGTYDGACIPDTLAAVGHLASCLTVDARRIAVVGHSSAPGMPSWPR